MDHKIRDKEVSKTLLDYDALAQSLKENTNSAVKSILDEAVRETYAKLLTEDSDKDYEESEVEDTDSDVKEDATTDDAVEDVPADGGEGMQQPEDTEDPTVEPEAETEPQEDAVETEPQPEGGEDAGEGDEWADFDKYKMSDGEYDFTNAEDEDIVKVYKLMKNDDQVFVNKMDDGKVSVQDNETGAEYLIDLGGNQPQEAEAEGGDFGAEPGFENTNDDMNESTEKLFELVMEYNSNVGYTDNYQKKDVMTNPGMSEPGKNVNDWDAGVPKGTEKPWSGYPSKKNKADKPFNDAKGKQVEEAVNEEEIEDGAVNELKTNAEHSANVGSTSRTDGPNNPRRRKARNFHTAQGGQETGTGDNAYAPGNTNEALVKKINQALKENKELKGTLTSVMKSLKEAALTNHNLAQIIKLISENTTSYDEKKEIINRFMNEAKTIDESKQLYKTITNDLQKAHKMNVTESQTLSTEGSKKINETPIYKSPDVLESLDLMHRMMK